MNRLSVAARTQVIKCLVEGNSIRSTERMCDVHRDTICRLQVEVGDGCQRVMDEKMRNLTCTNFQVDEIWTFVGKKQARLEPSDNRQRLGEMWTFVANSVFFQEDRKLTCGCEPAIRALQFCAAAPIDANYASDGVSDRLSTLEELVEQPS